MDAVGEAASPEEERGRFDAALAASAEQLSLLSDDADVLGAEILEFQLALIEDDELIDPVCEAIADGATAAAAWRARLDEEIADYRAAEDDYMAARASDLSDLRDRVLANMNGGIEAADLPDGAVIVAEDLTPSTFLSLDWKRLSGAVLLAGSSTSHAAILARSRGVPMVVDLGDADIDEGDLLAVDAATGAVIAAPTPGTLADFNARRTADEELNARAAERMARPARTGDGVPIRVLVNVNEITEIDRLSPQICDGVGLTRTEFLFSEGAPSEQRQYEVYRRLVAWAEGRPVAIRTLDAGGDKPLPGITVDGESNPFLGVRGVRLSLKHREVFVSQLRALARAASLGPLKVMVPMVSVPEELTTVRQLLREAVAALHAEGVTAREPALGMMVEVPAAALTAEDFAADFYSIGSNDLIQYTMAVARDAAGLGHLTAGDNPAVMELIRRTVAAGRARGVEVSLCGDMASKPEHVAPLLAAGLTTFSVAPTAVGRIKLAISEARAPGREARAG
ncbi:phosphotransferase system enzyme I (PtsI) [Rhodobium gokarnense]|uniref:Phosphoenolpyruvate-protein phosphotransferase n=1 Tax=Rhodobium gokarnense TaxID=364296 RepID=A0ABT3HFT8_9HYPH|nr:phosphotransferase system enzyme I (PtsI) [Rhodobium gokarnense]